MVRPSQLWGAALVLAVTVTACSSGSKSPNVPTAGTQTTAAVASTVASPLAEGLAYSQCMRSHGVLNWPDPVPTPNGSYGYRTTGVDPKTAAFQGALQACKALAPDWWSGSGGQQLSASQQRAWLDWAKCIRSHGVPTFADPTFPGGSAVHLSDGSSSPQFQSAMDACKPQMPTTGGLGG